jgi:hypothetical protein
MYSVFQELLELGGIVESVVLFHILGKVILGTILSCVGCVTYKMGFGLDDWIYYTLYIHNSELQAITGLSLSYTLCSSPFHMY